MSVGNESSRLRTPLPSGRSLEKPVSPALPGIESISGDLQNAAARIINSANPNRSRYDAVQVLLLVWSNDMDVETQKAVNELMELLDKQYNYAVEIKPIPVDVQSPYRWLLSEVSQFINIRDLRDTLKIVYYAGYSYLDSDREMTLSR